MKERRLQVLSVREVINELLPHVAEAERLVEENKRLRRALEASNNYAQQWIRIAADFEARWCEAVKRSEAVAKNQAMRRRVVKAAGVEASA